MKTIRRIQYLLLGALVMLSAACKEEEPLVVAPTAITGDASDIYRLGATLSGSIQNPHNASVKEVGIQFSELQSMAEYDELSAGTASGSAFSVSVSSLSPGQTYYYRAYASSGASMVKGEVKSFTTTQSNAPVFGEVKTSNLTEQSVNVSTSILDEGGSELVLSGFCWKAGDGTPTAQDNVVNATLNGSTLQATIDGLTPGQIYSIRPYGVNGSGVGYGATVTIVTLEATVPVLSKIEASDSTEVSITVKSSVVGAGKGEVTKVGFCYSSESKTPTTDHLVVENVHGSPESEYFAAIIEGLTPETTYYIRAYAENEHGIGYSEVLVYTTPEAPLIEGSEGDVHVAEAGGLSKFIDDSNKYNITKLKVSGYLNGDDIRLIREMSGRDINGNETSGLLVDLDISEATLVAGGDYYYLLGGEQGCYTKDNVIEKYMFYETHLQNILLPSNVTYIAPFAFGKCSDLTSVNIPEGVTILDAGVFDGCSALKNVILPESLTTMGDYMFVGCSSLESITIPDGVTALGERSFKDCYNLINVSLPSEMNTIGIRAFEYCTSLVSITIPKAVTVIDEMTFWGCSALKEVTLPEGLTIIGVQAFWGCSSLENVNIPQTVTTIAEVAFGGCSSLNNIVLSEGITTIESATFNECSSLTSITIPQGVTTIGESAFMKCIALEDISLPESLTSIGELAFYDCESLTKIILPSNLTSIGGQSFDGCTNLAEVTCLATTPASLGSTAFSHMIYNSATLYVPSGCEDAYKSSDWATYFALIDDGVADGSYANGLATLGEAGMLASLIPENEKHTITSLKVVGPLNGDDIRFIREMAGRNVDGSVTDGKLTELDLSEAMIVAGGGSYFNLSSSTSYYTSDDVIGGSMWVSTILKTVHLPNNVVEIDDNAFEACSALTSITLPAGVTSIGALAFEGCSSLTGISLPAGVASIGSRAFEGCSSLTSINIPEGVTSIEAKTFSDCSALTSITLPAGLTSIGARAFLSCEALTEVVLPNSLSSIGDAAFQQCEALTNVAIPDGVISIKDYTFLECSSLVNVTLGSGVTSIGVSAFEGCSSLTSINIPEGVTSIGESAFCHCSTLGSVVFPDGVTEISQTVFFQCFKLTDVNIPESVTKIGARAFYECNLSNIIIPNTVEYIGSEAFYKCPLTSIDIPDSVIRIGTSAFEQCSLNEVTIGSGLTELGDYAFLYGFTGDKFTIKATTPPTIKGSEMFNNLHSGVKIDSLTLYVPAGCATAYSESKWATFFENIVEM